MPDREGHKSFLEKAAGYGAFGLGPLGLSKVKAPKQVDPQAELLKLIQLFTSQLLPGLHGELASASAAGQQVGQNLASRFASIGAGTGLGSVAQSLGQSMAGFRASQAQSGFRSRVAELATGALGQTLQTRLGQAQLPQTDAQARIRLIAALLGSPDLQALAMKFLGGR